ncbi:MAG: hypothetical protein ACU84H_10585 [Gammaproteobacteria bacterium]
MAKVPNTRVKTGLYCTKERVEVKRYYLKRKPGKKRLSASKDMKEIDRLRRINLGGIGRLMD